MIREERKRERRDGREEDFRLFFFSFLNEPRRVIASDRIPANDQLSVISSWLVDQIPSGRLHTCANTRKHLIPIAAVRTNYAKYRFIAR